MALAKRIRFLTRKHWFTSTIVVYFCLVSYSVADSTDWKNLPPWAASPPWPEQIALESPDPVMGSEDPYEIWAYTENFANRFSNLPIDQVNNEMPPGLEAVVFRVYKRQLDKGWFERDKRYWCAMDLYIDSKIKLSESHPVVNLQLSPDKAKVGNSLRRLNPILDQDIKAKEKQDALTYGEVLNYKTVVFLDGELDGRSSTLGTEYRENALPGLNLLTLEPGMSCELIWPWRDGQRYVVSISGNDPYQRQQIIAKARKNPDTAKSPGTYADRYKIKLLRDGIKYYWHKNEISKGLLALPEGFSSQIFIKVLGVKTLNGCLALEEIIRRNGYKRMQEKTKEGIKKGCSSLRDKGVIYDAYNRKYGYKDTGENRRFSLKSIYKNFQTTRKLN